MATHHPTDNFDAANSVLSLSPPPYNQCDSEPLQFICSFGGQILPRRHNANHLCYIGGYTHNLAVDRCITFSCLLTKLSKLAGNTEIHFKYHLPIEDLNELISVTTDEDVENMMIAYQKLIGSAPHGSDQFLRLFLFSKVSPYVSSHTNGRYSDQEQYQYQEDQNFLNLEELQEEANASTDIPLVSERAIGSVPPSVKYKRLEPSDAQKQPELELQGDDSRVRKRNTFVIPSAMQKLETLWTWLNDDDVETIKIEGESGTGKAWMVRQIIDRARASNLFDIIIWVADYGSDIENLSKYRGRELIKKWLISSGAMTQSGDDIRSALEGKGYLLVMEECYTKNFDMLEVPHPRIQENLSKLVFVGSSSKEFCVPIDEVLEVKELSQIEARLVFESQSGLQLDDPEICKYAEALLGKCNGNLSMILVLAESLRRHIEEHSTSMKTIDTLQEAYDLLIDRSMPIVEVVYEMFPMSKQVRCCFLYFLFYFSSAPKTIKDPVNVVHLITFWIFGRCLDGYNCLADAYKRGEDILLELIDFFLIQRHDNEHVTPQSCTLLQNKDLFDKNVDFKVSRELYPLSSRENFLMNEELEIEYSLRTFYSRGLLVYGNEAQAPHEIPDVFFEKMTELNFFALQRSGIKSLPQSISTFSRLSSIVLRDCSSLEDVSQIRLHSLNDLDLSGASSLKNLPDDFFQHMPNICHLDLSHSQLKKMPSSFYKLRCLMFLFLQGCSHLHLFPERLRYMDLSYLEYLILSGCLQIQTIPNPDAFPNIQVLELSGASAFMKFQWKPTETYLCVRKIDLSGTKVVDVHFLSRCINLHELLLKNCSQIERVPCLSREVEILDLSGSVSFKKFEDESFGNNLYLLDLSRTRIKKLPVFSIDSKLRQLLLRECSCLEELPPLEFQKLQVLDLSGSINFKKFNDISFRKLRRIKTIDVSATQITELPNISECSHLQKLIFKNCPRLEILPQFKELTVLKVLDLSGFAASRKFKVADMEKMVKLQVLNLSGTQVVRIPSLDEFHDLRSLILRGCLKLESLPHLEALSRLEVLDLSGSVSFTTFQDQSLGMCDLQILDLSETQVEELPLLSGCSNLCQLLLRDCSKLKNMPAIDKPKILKVVDLSGTTNLDMSNLSECQNLRQLTLRGCSNLDAVSFECMHELEKVDLCGTSIHILPSCFSKLRNLNQLLLRECSNLRTLPQLESFITLDVLDISCQRVEESSSAASAHSRLLLTLNKNFLWDFDYGKYSQRFYFCLCSCKDWGKEKDTYLRMQEVVFRDIYYQTHHMPQVTEEPDKFFKICGFKTYPVCAEEVIVHAEVVYLENNDFITRLSDLGTKHVKVLKECWIESCQNMESCFYGEEEEENDALGKCLQNLSVSKLAHLKCLFRDVVNSKSFACLKNLYIECCPSLITIFSSHLELKHLDTLKIKFCDKLENVSGDMLLTEQTFPRLKTLSLWKLPKLHRVCTGALPLLEYLSVKRCPKLEKLPFSLNSTNRTLKIRGEKLWWDNLKCEDDTIKSHLSFTEFRHFL